ncbi:cysteine desulfurase family protein [Anaerosphaera multitolerans]|uniref:cysteine desulfurase n=1 Tax=Anaerosphaera multitolerans TaxID=2487351 RepID=A0A437S826_9FIRM|nr:cysteine desulfurase family protein [Anaerosphaera multitolerans]RVU55235.1 cysteine desulfurase [Anaerosphaera multitolerans]
MIINFDKAATTKLRKEVLEEMLPYLEDYYGNASSMYRIGQKSKGVIESSRTKIAELLNCKATEIYFTSGGTESDNWAIKGVADTFQNKGRHIITTKIEHHAVLHTMEFLESRGYEVTYLNVDGEGFVDLKELENSIRNDTILISVMYANNEIGTIEPIETISEIAKRRNILFHVDGVQALGNIKIDLEKLNVDLMSFSGHKVNGPKGIGILYVKNGTKITPLIHGGTQERGKRAGTENVAGIVGLGKAIECAVENLEEKRVQLLPLRDKLIEDLTSIKGIVLNGPILKRLPGNVNISIEGVKSQELLIFLDMKNICASSGSACTTGSIEPSHVLKAIGLNDDLAKNSLRLSLDYENTFEEVETVTNILKDAIITLRR